MQTVDDRPYEEKAGQAAPEAAQEEATPEDATREEPEARNQEPAPERAADGEKDADALKDQLLRLSAEFDNYKKRTSREVAEFKKYANETMAKELLPVLDNLERALESARAEHSVSQALLDGIDLTHKEFLKVLERYGVEPVEAVGNEFDPTFHQALMTEASDEHPENTVVKEMQKGYTMNGRLLRPALVCVCNNREGS